MSYEFKLLNAMRQFMVEHPETDYNNLDGVLKVISRITEATPLYLLSVALDDEKAREYLLGVLKRLEN